jgi:hypothetical protein
VLSFLNTQSAWEQARALNKPLRFSFGRADREYKDRWCNLCRCSPYESAHEPQTATAQAPSAQQAHHLADRPDRVDRARCAGGVVVAAGARGAGWIAHEAWFADHLFYSPKDDYQYSFPPFTPQPKVHLNGEQLRLDEGVMLVDEATLILAVKVKAVGSDASLIRAWNCSAGLIRMRKPSSAGSMACVT